MASAEPTTGAGGTSHHPRITDPDEDGLCTVGPRSPDVSQQAYNSPDFSSAAPYSPARAELESHPIRQRLSVLCDDEPSANWSELESGSTEELDGQALFRGDHDGNTGRFWSDGIMADVQFNEGDAAAYLWGGDKKGGTVTEVATQGSVTMETARGNTVEKEAKPNDPAVRLEREGHDVVKNASELHKESAGQSHNEGGVQKKVDENGEVEKKKENGEKSEEKKENGEKTEEKKANGEAKTGEKRAAEDEPPKENGDKPKKKKGRPAKNAIDGVKKEIKKRIPKKAATESGEPRRSGRNAGKSS